MERPREPPGRPHALKKTQQQRLHLPALSPGDTEAEQAARPQPLDVVFLHAVPDSVVDVELSPVVRAHAVSVLVLHAAPTVPLGSPLLVEEAADDSQSAHSDENHRRHHAWERQQAACINVCDLHGGQAPGVLSYPDILPPKSEMSST